MTVGRQRPSVSQQATASGFARIYQAAGNQIIYQGGERYRLAVWPAQPAPPTVRQARAQPSVLLRAANQLISFTGRDTELGRLYRWRDGTGEQVAVGLIHGPGGQGKTRLAGQVADLWRRQGWVVLAAHHRRDRSAPEVLDVPTFDGAAGVLVVADYAERWDTADLLALLADTRTSQQVPVRVLLLARPAGTWWQSLEYRIGRDLNLVPDRWELGPLEADARTTRAGLFEAARDRFADLLAVPTGRDVDPPRALADHEAYELVLTVHMAALAAVLAHDRGQDPPAGPVQVSELLLARERDHWEAMSAPSREKPLATSPDAMGQVVYTATLTGRLDYDNGKAALEQAMIESREHPGQLLKDHATCYPPAGHTGEDKSGSDGVTVLEPLYPDRLGEDYIALSTPGHSHRFPCDPWAEKAPARLLALPGRPGDQPVEDDGVAVWTRQGLTVLIEVARRWPHLAKGRLYPLLTAHPRLALHAGGAALTALTRLKGIPLDLLEAIEAVLPAHRHIDLDIGIAAVTERLAEHRLAATTDPATRAHIHDTLALHLSYAGVHARALTESHHAIKLWRHLAAADPSAYLPDLAGSVSDHALHLVRVGRRSEAVPLSEEAVLLRRELVTLDREAYLPDLAASVNNHAGLLAELGRRSEAVSLSEEAVGLFRELAAVNRDVYLPDLAMSVNNHAGPLAQVGRRSEAVSLSEEAVGLFRELAAVNREAYLPNLAGAVNNHASRLAEVGRRSEAVPLSEEAVLLRRELAALNRDAYLPNLAGAVNNHAGLLAEVGRRSEAVPLSEEAVGLYQELVALNRDAYLPNLAASVNNHARLLAEVGRRSEAVPLSEEAVGLYQELAAVNRDAYLPNLAISVNNHALRLAEVGRRSEAVPLSEEAVLLRRELAALNRDAYLPDLAMSVNDHAGLLAEVGRRSEAVLLAEEAVLLRRELAALNRDAYLSNLGTSVNNHANLLAEMGRRSEAVPLSEEAVGLFRELAALNRDAYLPELAASVNNHAFLLAQVGRRSEAVLLAEEAVLLSRELATLNRDAYLLGYTQSVTVLGYVLVEAERFREATAPLIEAFVVAQELPEYHQGIIGMIVDLLRRGYGGDPAGVAEELRALTGQDVPGWMKKPPAESEN
ncbi:hypothetical protein ABZU32_24930 [Sphaerisporangium sp. NPDC005288]|uniref:hypothetical protein n=1 Tax=Sphaerisporangium sp. NPDC005288 TaxID=3155114 RepID=UPI0033BF0C76